MLLNLLEALGAVVAMAALLAFWRGRRRGVDLGPVSDRWRSEHFRSDDRWRY
jgi:hypothetical protein